MIKQNFEMIELGFLMVMSAYHVTLFLQIKKKYYLYLGIICSVVLVRATLVDDGSQLFYQLFPEYEKIEGTRLEYLVAYSALMLMPMFIYDLYTFIKFRKYLRFFQISSLLLVILVALTPHNIYHHTLIIYHVLMALDFIFVFAILYNAIKMKQTGAQAIFYGLIVCFAFIFLEMLRNSKLIDLDLGGPNLVNTGVVAYLFFQSLALSSIFAKSVNDNLKLNVELEEIVAARTEQLTKSNLVKDRFIQIVSHDLRSPLGNLKGIIDLIKMDGISVKDTKKLMSRVNEQVDDSLGMLDDMLEWSKVSASRMKMEKTPIDLTALINDCIRLYDENSRQKKIQVSFAQTEPTSLVSDKNAVKVILRNLINNAIKFTPKGGTILITIGEDNGHSKIVVTDSGIGVPDHMKTTLFDMDLKNSRSGTEKEESSGVGLALCRDLITQINGHITVQDNPAGAGAIFTCWFKKN